MQEKAKHSKIPPRVSRTGTLGGGCFLVFCQRGSEQVIQFLLCKRQLQILGGPTFDSVEVGLPPSPAGEGF